MIKINKTIENINSPWYIKLLQGFSGWLGAFFFLIFFGGFFSTILKIDINKYPLSLIPVGILLIAIAYNNLKEKQSDFNEQFTLAFSVTGQALIILSIVLFFKNTNSIGIYVFVVLFQAFLVWLIHNYIHRMLSTFFMISASAYIFGSYLFLLILVSIITWIWMNEFKFKIHKQIESIAYGLTFSLVNLLFSLPFVHNISYIYHKNALFLNTPLWLIYISSFASLSYIVYLILKDLDKLNDKKVLISSMIVVLFISIITSQIQGLIICIILLLIGFAHSFKLLIGLGIFGTIAFISNYYYYTGETLLDKSILLAILGLVFLAIYFVFKFVFKKEIKNV